MALPEQRRYSVESAESFKLTRDQSLDLAYLLLLAHGKGESYMAQVLATQITKSVHPIFFQTWSGEDETEYN